MRRRLIALVVTASGVAFASGAFAESITTNIDFSCADGSGTGPGGALCSGSNRKLAAPVSLGSWTESGYTVTSTSVPTQEFDLTGVICASGCSSSVSYSLIAGNKDKIVLDLGESNTWADCHNKDLNPAPEPSSLVLMGTGILALVFLACRRAKSASPVDRT